MRKTVSTAVTGLLCGVLMAAVLLYMNIANHYQIWNAGYFACLAAGIALPLCLGIFRKEYIHTAAAQLIMICISFLVMLGYAYISSASLKYENSFYRMTQAFSWIHLASCAAVLLNAWLSKGAEHDTDD